MTKETLLNVAKLKDSDYVIENGRIEDTKFGIEDHGVLTLDIIIEGEGWGCSFGNYNMHSLKGIDCLMEILQTLDVRNYEEIKGQNVRVMFDKGDKTVAFGHLMKDRWFSFKQFFGT